MIRGPQTIIGAKSRGYSVARRWSVDYANSKRLLSLNNNLAEERRREKRVLFLEVVAVSARYLLSAYRNYLTWLLLRSSDDLTFVRVGPRLWLSRNSKSFTVKSTPRCQPPITLRWLRSWFRALRGTRSLSTLVRLTDISIGAE